MVIMNALVFNGIVVQIEAATFPVHSDLAWVPIPAGSTVAVGSKYVSGTFIALAAPPHPTLPQQAATLIAAGLTITSTSTPAIDATYPCDQTTQTQLSAEVISLMLNGTFADGSDTIEWMDVNRTGHTMTIAQFKTVATAIGAYVSGLTKCINGQASALPTSTVTVA
jgi:hypothetical protein